MFVHKKLFAAVLIALFALVSACSSSDDGASDTTTTQGADGSTTMPSNETTSSTEASETTVPEGDPIIIGVIEDTSGGAASYSQVGVQAFTVAINQINDAGGILGRPVEMIRESDGNEPTQTPALTRRLVENGADVILQNSGSASSVQAKPVCAELEVVCLAPINLSTAIGLPPDDEYSFQLANPITDIASLYIQAFNAAGYERIAVLADASPTIAGIEDLLIPVWEDAGIEITIQETAPTDATDVTAQVARMLATNPDALYFASLGGQLEVVVQNTMAQMAPDTPRFSLSSIGNQPEIWPLANPGALDGLLYAAATTLANPRTAELNDLLTEEVPDYLGMTAYYAHGYTGVWLIKEAIENAGTADDGTAIRDGMEMISGFSPWFGLEQYTVSFGPDKHVASDGLCGLLIGQFGPDNRPDDPWDVFQPAC